MSSIVIFLLPIDCFPSQVVISVLSFFFIFGLFLWFYDLGKIKIYKNCNSRSENPYIFSSDFVHIYISPQHHFHEADLNKKSPSVLLLVGGYLSCKSLLGSKSALRYLKLNLRPVISKR